jgi:hypothetical protein
VRNHRTKKTTRGEEGQFLVLFAMGLVAIMGFTALAIDTGLFYEDRRHLQNTADAAALAGAAELPGDPAAARDRAEEWVIKHGLSTGDIKTIEVRSELVANDTVHVELKQDFGWIFARALGMTTSEVNANASARIGSFAGGQEFLPWALLTSDVDCLDGNGQPKFGSACVVKLGAGDATTGWYGALDPDGNGGGSSEYRDNIVDGEVEWQYCIAGDPAPGCAGANTTIEPLSGNKVGPTDTGIEERLATGPRCDANGNGKDDFSEVLSLNPGGDPTYVVSCPDSPWLIIIPIVDYTSVPVKDLTIRGWMLAYLDSYSCSTGDSDCSGGKGHWEVNVEIVDAAYSQSAGFLGAYDPDAAMRLLRLVE